MHLKPTTGCQISNLIIGFVGGNPMHIHEQLSKNGTFLCHSRFKSKVFPGPLTDLST
jgi:hypothetical protein